ncbi:MAG: (Fe-S)-binding protein [Chloroflexi bacterium]|nr:(Fe-S)-binding protein [Chloroflexota bacterium]
MYQCADCGLCRAYCVTDQPLPLAIDASRAEVVARQSAPAMVYSLRDKLRRWSNPYVEAVPEKVSGQGEAALVVGAIGHYLQQKTVEAAIKLLDAAGVQVVPIALGRETPYLAHTLGLPDEARQLGQATLTEIAEVGARQVFVLSPGEIYTCQTLFDSLGLAWPKDVELEEVTAFLAEKVQSKQLSFRPVHLQDYAFYDPDHTVRVPGRWGAPRQLLAAVTQTPPTELFWRKERAAPCGASGGLYFTQPGLSAQLAQARLAEAQERGVRTLITDDPQTLFHLQHQAWNDNVTVKGLFELLAEQL